MTVLVYGALNPDIVHRLDRLPLPGDDTRSDTWHLTWGGKAANMAVALADWGVDVALTGLVIGDDPLGDALLAALRRPYLDLSGVERDSREPTRHCIVLVDSVGERTIVCSGYRDARWAVVGRWEGIAAVVADGFGGGAASAVVREAHRRGLPAVWLDAPPDEARHASLVVWSRHEHTPSEAAALADTGTPVALTAGAGPVQVWWGGSSFEVIPPQVPAPRDATAAGDVFAAACLRALMQGSPPVEVIESAVAVATGFVVRGRDRPGPRMPPAVTTHPPSVASTGVDGEDRTAYPGEGLGDGTDDGAADRGPGMVDDAWRQAGDRWSELAGALRERYGDLTGDGGPTEDEVGDAFRTLGDAARSVFDSVGSALRDPEVRRQMKGVASSLVSALRGTFDQLEAELRRGGVEDGTAQDDEPEAPGPH